MMNPIQKVGSLLHYQPHTNNLTPKEVIRRANGKFISVTFRSRRSGEISHNRVCRTGVKIGVKGLGMSYNAEEKGLVTAWDVRKKDYISIPLEGVIEIQSQGVYWRTIG